MLFLSLEARGKELQRVCDRVTLSTSLEGPGSPRTFGYINSECDLFILQGREEALRP